MLTILLLLVGGASYSAVRRFELALPGYHYSFPRDHYSHDSYKTEWWYYTGHLRADDGSRYGYELTFFRIGMSVTDPPPQSPWSMDNVYMAHFAISDINGRRFFHTQRLTRPGVGFAGASQSEFKIFNGNWSLAGTPDHQKLQARDYQRQKDGKLGGEYAFNLELTPTKPPAQQGENGVSQKASCYGCASHYYSLTRLKTRGDLTVDGRKMHVEGLSWMDHEFGSNQLTAEQAGWDWFAVQLDNNYELMLYAMRLHDGSIDPHSSGTLVLPDGGAKHLSVGDFQIRSSKKWRSPESGATYPIDWTVEVPKVNLLLQISPDLLNQELIKKQPHDVTYWEGSSTVNGTMSGHPVRGQSYVEMTGYASAFSSNI